MSYWADGVTGNLRLQDEFGESSDSYGGEFIYRGTYNGLELWHAGSGIWSIGRVAGGVMLAQGGAPGITGDWFDLSDYSPFTVFDSAPEDWEPGVVPPVTLHFNGGTSSIGTVGANYDESAEPYPGDSIVIKDAATNPFVLTPASLLLLASITVESDANTVVATIGANVILDYDGTNLTLAPDSTIGGISFPDGFPPAGGGAAVDHIEFTRDADPTPLTADDVASGDTATYHAQAMDADDNPLGDPADLAVTGTGLTVQFQGSFTIK